MQRVGAPFQLLLIASSGYAMAMLATAEDAVPEGLDVRRVDCVGTVVESARGRGGGIELVVAVDSLIVRSTVARYRGRVLVRIRDESARTIARPHSGDRVSVVGALRAPRRAPLPDGFDERSYLAGRGVGMTLSVDRASALHCIAPGTALSLDRAVAWVRSRMETFAGEYVGGREGAVVQALLDGDRSGIDRETRNAFATTGTMHVLAVSGLHVAVLALALAVLASWIPNRVAQFTLFAAVLGFYALVAGAGPSIVRAWCMAVCVMLARLIGRRTEPLNVLAFSALAILIVRPSDLFDIGFQLSYAAVAGIVLVNRRLVETIESAWPRLCDQRAAGWLVRSLALTASAQLLTLPLLLAHFGSAPVLGLLLNLPVVPLTSCAMAASALGVVTTPVPMLAEALGATAYVTAGLSLALVEWGAGLPLASVTTVPIGAAAAATAIAALLWCARARGAAGAMLRFTVAVIATTVVTVLDSRDRPFAPSSAPRAYIIPVDRGVLVGASVRDTLLVALDGDSLTALQRQRIDELARQTSSDHVELVSVGNHALRLGGPADAILLRRAPVAIDRSDEPVRSASIDGVGVLVVGVAQRVERAVIDQYNGEWRELPWR